MVEIREVRTRKEIKEFINFPIKLYKGNDNFVPALWGDEKAMFKKDYYYNEIAESKFWNAYKDGKMVGRIHAIWNFVSNKKWGQKRMRFTRFDAIDDQEVSNALLKTVEDFAKEKGMSEVVGPLGFSDLEREGLLIEGFDYLSTFEEQFNFPYYQKLIENYGYKKDVDWIEHRLFPSERCDKVIAIADRVLKKGLLKVVSFKSFREFKKSEFSNNFFEIWDATYDKIYGTVPITQRMRENVLNSYGFIMNMHYLKFVVDENDKIVAFAAAFPEFGPAFKKSNGHLYPWTIISLMKTVKHPKHLDLALVGVLPEGASKGAAPVIYSSILREIKVDKIEYLETNLNLENNHEIVDTWNHFDYIQHKRRRCYSKQI